MKRINQLVELALVTVAFVAVAYMLLSGAMVALNALMGM